MRVVPGNILHIMEVNPFICSKEVDETEVYIVRRAVLQKGGTARYSLKPHREPPPLFPEKPGSAALGGFDYAEVGEMMLLD